MAETHTAGSLPTAKTQTAPGWMKSTAMVTGVLAGLAGFLTVRSANTSDQAIYNSDQAVLHSTLASDHWSEYQADSIKRHIDESALRVGVADPVEKKAAQDEVIEMQVRQDKAQQEAHDEEFLRAERLKNSEEKLALKDMLDYAGVTAQLGIALASVAALTRRFECFVLGSLAGLVAIAVTGYALAYPYVHHLLVHR